MVRQKIAWSLAVKKPNEVDLTASFLKVDQCQPRPNCKTKIFRVQGIRLVLIGHNIADFAIGALRLATIMVLYSAIKWREVIVVK